MIQFNGGLLKKVEIRGATFHNHTKQTCRFTAECDASICAQSTQSPFTARLLAVTNVDKRQRVSWASQNNRHEARMNAHMSHSADDRCCGCIRICHRRCQSTHECSGLETAGARQTGDGHRLVGYISYTRQRQLQSQLRLHWKLGRPPMCVTSRLRCLVSREYCV